MGKIQLFHESDQEDSESFNFKTNKSYAKHYDEFRKKEVLGQLKNLESDTDSSSDDETTDEEVVDAHFDKEFFRTLAYLKRRDPSKYEEKPSFFQDVKPVEEVALEKRRKKEKPMTLKDYERKVIVEKAGIFEDEEDYSACRDERAESPSLIQQQKDIKNQIKQALSQIDTDDEELEQDNRKEGLLQKRTKTQEDLEKEQADYLKWLADKKTKDPLTDDFKHLKPLKDYWSSKTLSKEEAFLKDYILNKRFVDGSGEVPFYEDIIATSEDEEELEKQEDYERRYNFRFEEPDSEFIKRYPRNVEESIRIERNKRKEQRQAVKERKKREKEQKKRELEELKAIKLQEIKEKINKLKQIAATDNMDIDEEQLESDFDPEEHDRRMRRMFNEDYYEVDEGDQKPEFPELDEELGIENYDRENAETNDQLPYCEDHDFVMDADYKKNLKDKKMDVQEQMLQASAHKKKKGKRISKFAEMLKKEKPIFDPEDEKTYGEYIDEYYKLDYEDIIGDTPCRFRYVETVPNAFGLTIEEILMANTRELNRWASVKKTVQIRPKYAELTECDVYKKKALNEELKKKMLPSLYRTQNDSDLEEDQEIMRKKESNIDKSLNIADDIDQHNTDINKKNKINQQKKSSTVGIRLPHGRDRTTQFDRKSPNKEKKLNSKQHNIRADISGKISSPAQAPNEKSKKRKLLTVETSTQSFKKSKKNQQSSVSTVSEGRLRAFGINPKKFHNKLKYGGKERECHGQNLHKKGEAKASHQQNKFKG
ncbi:protein KRI1 homolog [Wyeomyia smithii]|uniref:protein KRI1 homolog n=1 Tax=Wyeomyia smithii TaxID=174621 RepID=UPI002467F94F|nr:protein KRI1 homolog [Wyeomyia smithii]